MRTLCLLILANTCLLSVVKGHGRLRNPPGRSSMWRDNQRVAKNYQDNELNCGGKWKQWEVNGGKCGVCGDPYGELQLNQPPNKYAQPILGKCYTYGMKYMDVHVQLTANHLGYMEFRLCPNNDFQKPVTQECLNQYLLNVRTEDGAEIGKQYPVEKTTPGGTGDIFLKLDIPGGVTCSQCVIQWRYVSGNDWGCDEVSCGIGLGRQESFWSCADIAIVPNCQKPSDYIVKGNVSPPPGPPKPETEGKSAADKAGEESTTDKNEINEDVIADDDIAGGDDERQKSATRLSCIAVGFWARTPNMRDWCYQNCIVGFCPDYMCRCRHVSR